MTMLKMIAITADLIKDGKTDREIMKHLADLKGSRSAQISKIMRMIVA